MATILGAATGVKNGELCPISFPICNLLHVHRALKVQSHA